MQKKSSNNTVSRETVFKLKAYEASLKEWQAKMNLVSNSSLENAWERHFEDSIQLFSLIPQSAKSLYDFGSGAGFPGMVIAIMASEHLPELQVSLVESTQKKTLYLKHVAELTDTNANVINDRIENLPLAKVDVITSRALANLSSLFDLSFRFCHKQTKLIFPKGKSYKEEIKEAQRNWRFDTEEAPSCSSDEGMILVITNLRRK